MAATAKAVETTWRRRAACIGLAGVLVGTLLALAPSAPAVAQATERCALVAPTTVGGEPAPDSGDIDIPRDARFWIRARSTGAFDALFRVWVRSDTGTVANNNLYSHSTSPHAQFTTAFHQYGPYTWPSDLNGTTLEVTDLNGGAIPPGLSVTPLIEVEVPAGGCDRQPPDVVGDRNGANPSNGEAGDPVTTGTGNFSYRPNGLEVLGPLTPTYNSMDGWWSADPFTGRLGSFGRSWTSLLDTTARSLAPYSSDLVLRLPTGRWFSLPSSGADSWVPPDALDLSSITRNPTTGTYAAVFDTGDRWSFDTAGRLTAIDDGRGAGYVVTRGANGVPTRVETRSGGVAGHAWTVVDTGTVGQVDEVIGPFAAALPVAPAGTPAVARRTPTSWGRSRPGRRRTQLAAARSSSRPHRRTPTTRSTRPRGPRR